jgi:hypothetical protein
MFKVVGPLLAAAVLGAAVAPAMAADQPPAPTQRGTALRASGNQLTLRLACDGGGKVTVTTVAPNQRLSSQRFICRDGHAVLRMRMSARTARAAATRGSVDAVVTVVSGGARSRLKLTAPVRADNSEPRTTATAAWYDNYGGWHNEGSASYVSRWPSSGYYTGSGRYYYIKEYRLTWPYNLATLYEYYYWTGSTWRWWGDYQCTDMNILPSDTCTWFPAR